MCLREYGCVVGCQRVRVVSVSSKVGMLGCLERRFEKPFQGNRVLSQKKVVKNRFEADEQNRFHPIWPYA